MRAWYMSQHPRPKKLVVVAAMLWAPALCHIYSAHKGITDVATRRSEEVANKKYMAYGSSGGLRRGPETEPGTSLTTEESFDAVNSVFSLRRPRDFKAGLSSGGKSIAKGLVAGTVGLLAAPAIGAASEGLPGFAKGLGIGLAGAVLLPVTGVGVGLAQIVRGAVNTPEAVREASRGRFWDQEAREWIDRPSLALVLDDEIFGPAREQWHADPNNQPSTSGADSQDYYALLGVSRNATPEQIKRQYYLMARKMHPDKNPNDPLAKDRFQQLGEAYQVLGNTELRERYDAHGAQGLDVNFMDASEFFTMLFGSDKFEHLLGELMIAAAARNGGDFSLTQLKKLQGVRIERLVVMLKALLRRWEEGDELGFKVATEEVGKELADTSFGAKILLTLGRVYEMQADIFLGGIIDGTVAGMRSRMHTLKTQMSAAGLAIKVFQAQQQMEQFEKKAQARLAVADMQKRDHLAGSAASANPPQQAANGASQVQGPDPQHVLSSEQAAERAAMEEAALPLMLDAMWAANVLDIESTVRSVCKKTLSDPTADKAARKARARGLRTMGTIFQTCAQAVLDRQLQPEKGSAAKRDERARNAKQQMEDAMQRVINKRHAMDDAIYGSSA